MGSATRPGVYTIPAHRGFADALVTRLIADFGKTELGLANAILLIPNNRAGRAITEAFVRRSEPGMLLPRMVPLGDLELDERLGSALDPIGSGPEVPPAIDPLPRRLLLSKLVSRHYARSGEPLLESEALRLASDLAQLLDQLQVERKTAKDLAELQLRPDLQEHWQRSLDLFAAIYGEWPRWLGERGLIDPAERRNRLIDHVAARWRETRPTRPIIAAGITTSAPAIASLLRVVAELDNGMVVLPHLDLVMPKADWDLLGPHDRSEGQVRTIRDWETHPQYHLKLLLDRMGIARDEVLRWTRSGESDAPAQRSHAISHAFALPDRTDQWVDLDARKRRLSGVTMLVAEDSGEEAQAIAIAIREAIEQPQDRVALVTPDRALATRVAAHLKRWGIDADDSAGDALGETPAGSLLAALLEAVASRFAPVELMGLLKHPLVQKGEGRVSWLQNVRALDIELRGPRPDAGLRGVGRRIERYLQEARDEARERRSAQVRVDRLNALKAFWSETSTILAPLERFDVQSFAEQLETIREALSSLSGDEVWRGQAGGELGALMASLAECAADAPDRIASEEWPAWLGQLVDSISVRPSWGGHPRVAIYGLLEARQQQADFVICSGLNEGVWPQIAAPDPWLAPAIRKLLGLPALERNIGLSAHDLASAMGAPRLLLTRSRRSEGSPAVASRFFLRLQAMAGPEISYDTRLLALARQIDRPDGPYPDPCDRPAPDPAPEQRSVALAITDVDRLKADPYAFYAKKILRLRALDSLDEEPGAALRGTLVHDILEAWAKEDGCEPARLLDRANALLDSLEAHPLMRTLWQPRFLEAIEWLAEEMTKRLERGDTIAAIEQAGRIELDGVVLHGRADRIDRLADGSLGIVDYKTGKPPGAKQVAAGFAPQLGLIGLIAERGGFDNLSGVASAFEYWTLAKSPRDNRLGYVASPVKTSRSDGRAADEMVAGALGDVEEVIASWIRGREPFHAKLHPEYAPYGDYDRLMRLEEWYGRGGSRSES